MYKKVISIVVIILMIGGVILGFILFNKNQEKETNDKEQTITNENTDTNTDDSCNESNESARIKLTFNDNSVYVRLNDSKSSNDLGFEKCRF